MTQHNHPHTGHKHNHSSDNIRTAFFLNLFFVVVELIGGYFTNSLAIIADALHDLGDSLALGLAWYLDKKSKGSRTTQFSYGLGRLSLLSALFTSLALLIGSLVVFSQAVPRLLQPQHSDAQGMILFAIFGILINGFAALRLKKGITMNEKAIFWHMLEDVLGWVAILFTGIFIYFQDVHFLDPLLSILIAAYVLWNTIKNLKATFITFLQGVPDGMSIETIEASIKAHKDILEVHDTHIWTLDGEKNVLTSHVVIANQLNEAEIAVLKCDVKKILHDMHISHSTIELERQGEECQLGSC